jgi:hypothetical protein
LSVIWIGSNLELHSQVIDTICIPTVQAKKIYGDALKFRYTDSLLKLTESQLAEKRQQLQLMEDKESEVANNHRREIVNLENQVGVLKEQVQGFEKMWKRERRKRRLSQAGGIVAVIAAVFLSTK